MIYVDHTDFWDVERYSTVVWACQHSTGVLKKFEI